MNPYRTDGPATDHFVGRAALIEALIEAITRRRNAIHAVMGGRGMGKSSLVEQIRRRLALAPEVRALVVSGSVSKVARDISKGLKTDITGDDPVDALVTTVQQHPEGSVVILLDEVERVLDDPEGIGFLDNLREAYERSAGRLAIIVLGGTEVRDLLTDKASPFLRIAGGLHTLTGLARDEAAELLRAPLRLDVPDEVVDALWAETAGHPWLLRMFMENAVDLATSPEDVLPQLPAAIRKTEARMAQIGFPIWWSNLRSRGQDTYRRIARAQAPIPREEWVTCLGDDPRPWINVLTSTGVASQEGDVVCVRGTLFQRWVEENHPGEPRPPGPIVGAPPARVHDDALGAWLTDAGVDDFERLVVRSLATWARATVERPAHAVRDDGGAHKGDNSSLQPEAYFQMFAITALLQHERDLFAEAESLSMKRAGRSDIKVRSRHDPTRRACVEVKIFSRGDYETAVQQVLGYAAPGDSFAAVICVDRCKRPLTPEYKARCFDGAQPLRTHEAPAPVRYPACFTEHALYDGSPLRVWHILVQFAAA